MNIRRWLTTTNHKDIGILYILASFLYGFIGGLLALLMRAQTSAPGVNVLSSNFYYQAVTLHGLVMVLWFVAPLAIGFANYFVPLMIGCRDLAFPRLNALTFWLFLFSGLVAASALFLPGGAINTGWTVYAPLSTTLYTPGAGVVLGVGGLAMLLISSILSTINFLATIALMRAPGMSLLRMPLFVWFMLATLIIMFLNFPVLTAAGLMLFADRLLGTSFFAAPHGTILWGHLFWFFGHPEVYVVLFPALGVMAEIIPVFARRPIYGKNIIIGSLLIATFMSLVVWGHHMFLTGVAIPWRIYMSIMTELISVPFGIIVLCFIATLGRSSIRFKTPMLFIAGVIPLFIFGGSMGVFNSSAALDYSIRGTYWIVSHFHYILAASVAMSLIAGLYYWFPKITGRMYRESLGKIHFWLTFIGLNLTYFPMILIRDMPRRMAGYTPADPPLWAQMNFVSAIGAITIALAQLLFLYNIISSLRRGVEAEADPWGGYSLEWTVTSPPPAISFEKRPVISGEGVVQYEAYATGGNPSNPSTEGT